MRTAAVRNYAAMSKGGFQSLKTAFTWVWVTYCYVRGMQCLVHCIKGTALLLFYYIANCFLRKGKKY